MPQMRPACTVLRWSNGSPTLPRVCKAPLPMTQAVTPKMPPMPQKGAVDDP